MEVQIVVRYRRNRWTIADTGASLEAPVATLLRELESRIPGLLELLSALLRYQSPVRHPDGKVWYCELHLNPGSRLQCPTGELRIRPVVRGTSEVEPIRLTTERRVTISVVRRYIASAVKNAVAR